MSAREWSVRQSHAAALSRSYLAQRRCELAQRAGKSRAFVGYLSQKAHLAVLAENELAFRLDRYEATAP